MLSPARTSQHRLQRMRCEQPSVKSAQRTMAVRAAVRHAALAAATLASLATADVGTASAAVRSGVCNAATVVASALPAIVNITAIKVIPTKSAAGEPIRDSYQTFVGTGVIIDPSGFIVTNRHVIQDAAFIRVTFRDQSQAQAQLVAAASITDLAVLKVNVAKPLPVLRFGDSDALQVGQEVVAIGNPLGLGTSVSVGVVSALDRNLMRTPFDDYIQTDATINPGNSGGPLLDCSDRVIGINTALVSNNRVHGSIGLGFALPSDYTKFLIGRLLYPHSAPPNWVGLGLQTATPRLAKIFGLPGTRGAIVTNVVSGSPAASAGLKAGDIITGVNGLPLSDARDILRTIVVQLPGQPLAMSVLRQRAVSEVTLRGEPWPHMMAQRGDVLASAASIARAQADGPGLELAKITPAIRRLFGLSSEDGVLVAGVYPGSLAANMGFEPGDVIERVDDWPAASPDVVTRQLMRVNADAGNDVALLVRGKESTSTPRRKSLPRWTRLRRRAACPS